MKKTTVALVLTLFLASCYTEKERQIEAESAQFSIQTDTTYHKSGTYVLRLVKAKSYNIKISK